MRGHNIACIGELLIDFVCTDIGLGLKHGARFLKKAGGAPANVAAAINRSGGPARRQRLGTMLLAISCFTRLNRK